MSIEKGFDPIVPYKTSLVKLTWIILNFLSGLLVLKVIATSTLLYLSNSRRTSPSLNGRWDIRAQRGIVAEITFLYCYPFFSRKVCYFRFPFFFLLSLVVWYVARYTRFKLRTSNLHTCSMLSYASLPESQCYGNFDLLQLFQPVTK